MAKKYIDADLLRKEIDKWVEAMTDAVGDYSDGVRFALNHFTFVLDSLQQEQQEEPDKDLEEEMDEFFETMPVLEHENIFEDTFKNIARHFAKWGAEHTKKDKTPVLNDIEEAAEKYLDIVFGKGKHHPFYKELFIAGAVNEREQMMKGAMEKTVGQLERQWEGNIHFMHGFEVDEMDFPFLNSQECGYGDKVRIIVLPKEDEK